MSTLYITELAYQGRDAKDVIAPAAVLPPVTEQTLTISGVSNPSAAFDGRTAMIRVISDVVCSVIVGTTPVATTTKMRLAANSAEYFMVQPGASLKIAVIANT